VAVLNKIMYFQEIRNGPYIGLDNANRLFSFLEMVENDLNLILKNEKCVLKLEIISVHPMFLRQEFRKILIFLLKIRTCF